MPRGGAREGAGRKSNWVSGCMFSETVTIRVPRVLKDKVLDLAHRLDAGEEIDLVSKSIVEENQYLKQKLNNLKSQIEVPRQLQLLPNDSQSNDLSEKAKEMLYDDALARSRAVSYTPLDVYKRQDLEIAQQ